MAEFQRPKEGFRFNFGGVNTKDVPDALPPDKYAAAQNIRSTGDKSVRTRPGYTSLFATGNNAITDIRGYAALGTDSLPRFLARDSNGTVWLDDGIPAGNMNGNAGYGCSMLPFRPAESPQTWMYVGSEGDYQKFSAPDSNNVVTQYKVGIAEPQQTLQAAPLYLGFTSFTAGAGNWSNNGTAGAVGSGNRSMDSAGACFPDPAQPTRYYVQVGNNNANAAYQISQHITVGNASMPIQDVLPAVNVGNNFSILTIRYSNGNNGGCIIVPSQIPLESTESQALASLRRGSLLRVGGNETVLVLGTIFGPNGSMAFETSTNNTWTADATLAGLPSIAIDGNGATFSPGQAISESFLSSNLTSGVGNLTQALAANPFAALLLPNTFAQEDDYIHMSINFSDPTQLIQMLIVFNLDAGNTYTGDALYYSVGPGELAGIINGNNTVLSSILQAAENELIASLPTPGNIVGPALGSSANNNWTEVLFPISSLTRVGGDQTRTLLNCTGVQLQLNVANNVTFQWGGLWVGGGGQPDTGNNGAPYSYQAVPLSSLTGVRGNPTALMRYGVTPRRQNVIVKTSSLNSSYDPQIDTWEVSRYGGSITSYRFLGPVPVGTDFIDQYFDDTAQAGNAIVTDNTEPWPSIDVPWKITANNSTTIQAYGDKLVITAASYPATVASWLPGTIFQVGGNQAYTLRYRPTPTGNNNASYLFQFQECIGAGNQTQVLVLEPNVARQTRPYLWGPDAYGFFFGCGDLLRPGVVSWCKQYAPDAAPTGSTRDLCPPSEPMLGGEVIRGIGLVASSKRWWALYFQQGGNPLYTAVEIPVGKRLASPFGKCTDGEFLYFWATSGICYTGGGEGVSLTDVDLYNIFPHGGLAGVNVSRNGITFYAPDYSRAATFRLAIRDGILYATYQDSTGTPRVLIGQLRQGEGGPVCAWSSDAYAASMTVPYAIEQPKGTLELPPALYPAVVMGDAAGKVWKLQDFTNDNGTPIPVVMAPFEWDGGDLRSSELWGDLYLDCRPRAQITAQPVSQGQPIVGVPATIVASSASRQFPVISMAGGQLVDFLGIQLNWTDDFTQQTQPTFLHAWQPSYADQVETTTDRASDWTDCGTPSNKFFQGIIIDANTFDVAKNLEIEDADTGTLHVLQPTLVTHNGRQTIAYSFVTPFLAHSVRDVPQDKVPWMKYAITYVFEPTPESVQTWSTQWTALGGVGYKHIPRIEAAYAASASVNLRIKSFDGLSPVAITLPATGGVYQKILLTPTLNKGQLYQFSATSTGNFQVFLNDWTVWVGAWGRQGTCDPHRIIGGQFGEGARI